MKMHRITILAGIVLGWILLASCNRPIPTSPQSAPPQPGSPQSSTTLDALSLTRTGLSGQIMATLTVAQVTFEKPEETGQITTGAAPTTSMTSSSPTEAAVKTASPTATPEPAAQTAAPLTTVETAAVVEAAEYIPEIPSVYNLHRGEFPWCLARRYNIDPMQIIRMNGFFYGQTFYAGQPVFLPQNPFPFPGPRALHRHPGTYTVGWRDTIYTVACFFGDVDPIALAQANGLSAPYRLNPGQTLIVP